MASGLEQARDARENEGTALTIRMIAAWAVVVVFAAIQAHADPILVVSNSATGSAELTLNREDLQALPQTRITTKTDFTDGRPTFAGPRVLEVLSLIDLGDATVARMVAANDYAVEIDLQDIRLYDPIFAIEMNDNALSLRDKGPIWLMYPIDSYPELQVADFNAKLIWQLVRVELR